jgi:hypothetical protein
MLIFFITKCQNLSIVFNISNFNVFSIEYQKILGGSPFFDSETIRIKI